MRFNDFKQIASAAKSLSKSLSTRALTYGGTDETDNGVCELFENGERIAKAGDKKSIALLTKENVVLPVCYPAKDAKKTWLAVEKPSMNIVERADLIG